MTRLRNLILRLRRSEAGNATIEFVILFPVFITLFVSSFELAIVMVRQVMLERAVDLAVRDLRLGNISPVTATNLKTAICNNARIIPDCERQMMLELQSITPPNYAMPDPAATCVDRGSLAQPIVTFRDGPENGLMIVRACAMVDPFFPGTGLALKLQENIGDGFALVATSAYVNEPGAGV